MAKIKAYDYSFPVSDAVILAWAQALTIANIPRDHALEAVDRLYVEVQSPNFKPLPGALVAICREIRRERYEQDRHLREEQEKALEPEKITMSEWEARHGQPFPVIRLGHDVNEVNPITVQCPWCHASAGNRCVVPGTTNECKGFHDARKAVVEGRCAPWARWHVEPHTKECDLV